MHKQLNLYRGFSIIVFLLINLTGAVNKPLFASSGLRQTAVVASPVERPGIPLQDVTQIATGGNHACALTRTGAVLCWGDNRLGQLGDGTNVNHTTPVMVNGLHQDVRAIVAGNQHTCALLTAGLVKCWGDNSFGELGDGTKINRNAPVTVLSLSNNVSRLAAGEAHNCVVLLNGAVRCWGSNAYGQLGDNTTSERTAPVDVPSLSNGVGMIAAGSGHTCALVKGSVMCWGNNGDGQLGVGTTLNQLTPTSVVGLSGEVTSIATGRLHSCAVLANSGGIQCWGNNYHGQLGNGTNTGSASPLSVLTSAGAYSVTAGDYHTCALIGNGNVWCWGNNRSGQLGDGTTDSRSTPVSVVGLNTKTNAIAAGVGYSCAVMSNGSVACWGANPYGQQGSGDQGSRSTPAAITEIGADVSALTTGNYHSCLVTNKGSVKCWGRNDDGQVGDGTTTNRMTPTDVIGLSGGVRTVVAGGYHTCALLTNNSVKCWGRNDVGQLGDGSISGHTSPVDVSGLSSGVTAIAAGTLHTCALLTNGSVKCWGNNTYGQIGDNSIAGRRIPTDVANLIDATKLVAKGYHTCSVNLEGSVKCWGSNANGEIGDGTTDQHLTPTSVLSLTNGVTVIGVGGNHTCASKTDGVYCWGNNSYGQLGNGAGSRLTPDRVIGLTGTVTVLAANSNHTCAVVDNSAQCWGYNGHSEMGNGKNENQPTPTLVTGLTSGVSVIDNGLNHSCAIVNSNVRCWGDNDYGQLGNTDAWRTQPMPVLITLCYKLNVFHTGEGSDPIPVPSNSVGCPVGYYVTGATVMLHAAPAANFLVNGWQGAVVDVSSSTDNSMIMPASDASINVAYTTSPSPIQGDVYEDDNTCAQAHTLATDGVAQTHTFYQVGDTDWLRFEAKANVPYRITVSIPLTSSADVVLVTRNHCDDKPVDLYNQTFSPGVLTTITRAVTGTVYLQMSNVISTVAGPNVAYQVAVRPLATSQGQHTLILVAGGLSNPDSLQTNIDHVVKTVYQFYHDKGYSDDDIFFLTNQPLPGRDAAATLVNLQAAITDWAQSRLTGDQSLTLYLMDHGNPGKFYLDSSNQQELTPTLLNTWLDQLQSTLPDVKITIIIEACYSGSFISSDDSISKGKANRLVLTSTNPKNVAYASATGAYFSDFFLTGLRQGYSLLESFRIAYGVTHELFGQAAVEDRQEPQLDANANGVPNEPADVTLSTQYQAGYTETPQMPNQAPYVASLTLPAAITNHRGLLQATVHDDERVQRVWAVIKPPSYRPPASSSELVPEALSTIVLLEQRRDSSPTDYAATFAAEYPGFAEVGLYQIAVYAEDDKDLVSNPKVITVRTGSQLFLPLVRR